MKNLNINPMGLKGNQINERMKELMGISSINENTTKSAVELTKIGPDGKSYAIVRENHEYFIKVSNKTSNLLSEDFNYIGGLQNKKSEAYSSYAKAIKHLNLNFKSLAEAYGKGGDINVFENDNLLTENALAGGFSQYGGSGFSNEGNMEHNTPMFTEEEDCYTEEEDGLSEAEKAIDEMIKNPGKYDGNDRQKQGIDDDGDGVPNGADKDPKDGAVNEITDAQKELDTDEDGDIEADDLADLRAGKKVNESRLSIELAMDSMDELIEGLKKKVQ
jgi:hypothetical protein